MLVKKVLLRLKVLWKIAFQGAISLKVSKATIKVAALKWNRDQRNHKTFCTKEDALVSCTHIIIYSKQENFIVFLLKKKHREYLFYTEIALYGLIMKPRDELWERGEKKLGIHLIKYLK